MAILTTGNPFSTGQQVTAASLNAAVNSAAFAAGAIDIATMQFVGTNDQIGIKDLGVSTGKIASLAVTGAKIAETTITPTKLSAGAPAWTTTALNVTNSLDFAPITTALSGTYGRSGTLVTVTMTAHGMVTGNVATLDFTAGTPNSATDGAYPITVTDANTFTITDTASGTITGTPSVSRTNYYGNATIRGSESVTGNLSVTGNTAITGSATVGSLTVGANFLTPLTRGTALTPSGLTNADFTSLPSTIKRITLIFTALSTTGISNVRIQLGVNNTVQTTGYAGSYYGGAYAYSSYTGIDLANLVTAAAARHGTITFTNIDANKWVFSGIISPNDTSGLTWVSSGTVSLNGVLNMIRVTTFGGTDTFDGGSINIMYE